MGSTSYTARIAAREWPSVRSTWRWEPILLVVAALMMAVGAGFGIATLLMGGARIEEASMRTAELAGKYHRLHEADFTETLFPIAEGIGSLGEARGFPATCGVVISGIDTSGARPVVKWQRAHGTCSASRIGGSDVSSALPARLTHGGANRTGGVLAVEVFSSSVPSLTADRDGYAVSFAAAAGGVVPVVGAGERR